MSAVQIADGVWRLPLAPHDRLSAFLFLLQGDDVAFAHGPQVSTGARTAVRAFLAGRPG
jgi:hypothetical protein